MIYSNYMNFSRNNWEIIYYFYKLWKSKNTLFYVVFTL